VKKLITVLLLFLSGFSFAQNPITQNIDNDRFENKAKELTEKYSKQLVLTGKQIHLFESKIEGFLINENKIRNSNFSTKQKISKLKLNSGLKVLIWEIF